MRVLVTGGTGYIGAHTVDILTARGDDVLVADDVATGSAARIPGVPLVRLDLAGESAVDALTAAMREHQTEAVVHFAARKQVGESVERPAWYHQQNVGGLANVLLAMESTGVAKLVFSSSAAVYGHASGRVDERHSTLPISPYGATKLIGEQLAEAATVAWPLSAASLRYFNVGGAARPELGDVESLNLIPMVFDRIAAGEPPLIFGDDYATADGTCIRDYVHVGDVAEAHLAVLDGLGERGHSAYNLGTGRGTSVREMISAISAVAGYEGEPGVRPRRAGDPDDVVADVEKIRQATGWSARYSVDDIVTSAWHSRQFFDERATA